MKRLKEVKTLEKIYNKLIKRMLKDNNVYFDEISIKKDIYNAYSLFYIEMKIKDNYYIIDINEFDDIVIIKIDIDNIIYNDVILYISKNIKDIIHCVETL